MKPNFTMAALFEKNLERIDFPVDPDDERGGLRLDRLWKREPGHSDDPSLHPHLAGWRPRPFARVRRVGRNPAGADRDGCRRQSIGHDCSRSGRADQGRSGRPKEGNSPALRAYEASA
jgi:hypothetical protein